MTVVEYLTALTEALGGDALLSIERMEQWRLNGDDGVKHQVQSRLKAHAIGDLADIVIDADDVVQSVTPLDHLQWNVAREVLGVLRGR